MPRKQRDKETSKRAIAIAREHWQVKPGQVNPQARLRIPARLSVAFAAQSSDDRGAAWVDGYTISQNRMVLYQALEALSGHSTSIICDTGVTLVVGQESFQGDTTLEALLRAIAFYSASQIPSNGLDDRLRELDLLE